MGEETTGVFISVSEWCVRGTRHRGSILRTTFYWERVVREKESLGERHDTEVMRKGRVGTRSGNASESDGPTGGKEYYDVPPVHPSRGT